VNTCVVIVDIETEGEVLTIGCLVDSVKEVFEMEDQQIAPPPRMGTSINAEFLRGMGELDAKFLMILDIEKVLSVEELSAAASAAGAATMAEAETVLA
jgi:purine-binding chemotaxis protein CheW